MAHIMKRTIFLVLLAAAIPPLAAGTDATTKQEIAQLLDHLGASGCRFNRNGTWYDASRAVAHLDRKYKYLIENNLVGSVEEFIERAASASSASGKPYLVKCGNGPEMQSAAWFRGVLLKFREASRDAQRHP
jgi:hypothetical protein